MLFRSFANAIATLGVAPKEVTWRVGVDVLCFGGTKNGMPVGEAVVFFRRDLASEFAWRCKQAGQLASKMRFLAAPWVGLLQTGAWLRHAANANRLAARLTERLRAIPGIQFLSNPQVNSVFLELPLPIIEALRQRGWKFYTFIGQGGIQIGRAHV